MHLQSTLSHPPLTEAKYLSSTWYNFIHDLGHYGINKEDILSSTNGFSFEAMRYFPKEIVKQQKLEQKWIDIPNDVLDHYRMWRPTPLVRAKGLEKSLNTKCKIFYKNETISPTGSYKLNTAIPQAYYYKMEGAKSIVADTGAGHWAAALSYAAKLFDLPVTAFMVNQVDELKPMWRKMLELQGMNVHVSPSMETNFGRKQIEQGVTQGTLAIAISEALEFCQMNDEARYVSGCLFNHVLLHQSVVGIEAVEQLGAISAEPDYIVGACGGGSNLSGLSLPFINPDVVGGELPEIAAVESSDYPTLTAGKLMRESIGLSEKDMALKMYSLGKDYASNKGGSAGGLRYHGVSPIISQLVQKGIIKPYAYEEAEAIKAARIFAKSEGIIPAIESSFALRHIIDICDKNRGKEKVILFNLSGNGYSDIDTLYEKSDTTQK